MIDHVGKASIWLWIERFEDWTHGSSAMLRVRLNWCMVEFACWQSSRCTVWGCFCDLKLIRWFLDSQLWGLLHLWSTYWNRWNRLDVVWSLIVDLHFAAGTTVTQHAEVIVDSSFPGWELGRRAASANAHINNKIITVVTDAWYIYEIPAYYWQIIFHQIFTITATYNIGNWIRILLFYQFDSICIFVSSSTWELVQMMALLEASEGLQLSGITGVISHSNVYPW